MGQTAGAIYEPKAAQVCSLAGIETIRGKLATLADVRRAIMQSTAEVDKAKDDQQLAASMLMGAKLAKASIDAFISIAAEFAGPWGKVVSGGYKSVSALAEAGGQYAAGEKVDVYKTASKFTSAALGTVSATAGARAKMWATPSGNSPVVNKLESLAAKGINSVEDVRKAEKLAKTVKTGVAVGKMQVIKTDIIVDAMNGDASSVKKNVFLKYSAEIGSMTLDALKAETAGKVLSVGKELVNYNLELAKIFEEASDNQDTSALDGVKRSFKNQLIKVERSVERLQKELNQCERELGITAS